MNREYKKILVIKWGALGDLIASTPAIKALRENYPGAHITLLTNPLMKQIIPPGFLVDEHITINTNRNKIEDLLLKQMQIINLLRKKKFNLTINLRWTSERAALITYLSGSGTRVSSGPRSMMWPYTIKLQHPVGRYHEIHRNLDIVKSLGVKVLDENPVVYISDENENFAERFYSGQHLINEKVICIHPGASRPVRAWMPERFAEIGKLCSKKFNVKIIITWGKGEEELAQKVADLIGTDAILCDETKSIGDLAAIIKKSKLFFSNCTGPMNLAVAVKTPVVALLGSSDETDWGAYGKDHINIKSPLKLEHYTDEDEHKAMEAITVENVWEVISNKWRQLNHKDGI